MKKKNVATVMAAAMTLGTVAPAFASEVQTRDLTQNESVDVRLASGFTLYTEQESVTTTKTVFKRSEIFNYNGAAENRDKHTLKSKYADKQILVKQLESDVKNAGNDLFVLGNKSDDAVAVSGAKTKLETLKSEIEAYKAKGYTVNKKTTSATLTNDAYVDGVIEIELVKTGETSRKVTFTGIDEVVVSEQTDAQKTAKLRKDIFGDDSLVAVTKDLKVADKENITTPDTVKYAEINELKYKIEKNVEKFDVAVDEAGTGNKDLVVTLYTKGAKKIADNTVKVITFENVKDAVESLIIDMPLTGDFTGHWAQEAILDAMLAGKVDASASFRPQDSITRAEFAKIACTIFNIVPVKGQDEPFHDVAASEWYHEYVAALYNKKVADADGKLVSVIQGDGENFRPNAAITRQEVAVIVAKLTKNAAVETVVDAGAVKVDKDVKTKFKDDADIATWADESVQYLNETAKYDTDKAIVEGDGGKFYPTQSITRAESLVMVQRAATATIK